jgi:hypothetical protein
MGSPATFQAAGFREVARTAQGRVIMRWEADAAGE